MARIRSRPDLADPAYLTLAGSSVYSVPKINRLRPAHAIVSSPSVIPSVALATKHEVFGPLRQVYQTC